MAKLLTCNSSLSGFMWYTNDPFSCILECAEAGRNEVISDLWTCKNNITSRFWYKAEQTWVRVRELNIYFMLSFAFYNFSWILKCFCFDSKQLLMNLCGSVSVAWVSARILSLILLELQTLSNRHAIHGINFKRIYFQINFLFLKHLSV